MLFRAQVRATAIELLQAAITQNGAQVTSSKDNPVQTGSTPSVVVYTDDKKTGTGTAPPQFRTDVLTTVEIVAEGTTIDAAQTLCDTLCETVENTLLNGGSAFQQLFEQIDSVETRPDYRGVNAKVHTFVAVIEIMAHVTEIFEPTVTDSLNGVNIYVDSINIFDPNGTYEPPFDYSIGPAPRGEGPDGRAEIGGSADFGPVITDESGDDLTTENGLDLIAPNQP